MGLAASQIGPNYFSVHGTEGMLGSWARSIYIGVWRTGDAAAVHATVHLKKKGGKLYLKAEHGGTRENKKHAL